MFQTLTKAGSVTALDRTYAVQYFVLTTLRGKQRYFAEVRLGPTDRVILDDDERMALEARVARLVPVCLFSRSLLQRNR